ncbi:hypothetical protein KPH14_009153 [Odynerus spinipes]|uniref:F-box domain-containing protein n=1 Tax=Odynerus spinipes TaxID=1348599 RepID=A0AAD9VQD2_9HYME|nr:hypothetical protein KPH14_009153 [Odynerus spinipes]
MAESCDSVVSSVVTSVVSHGQARLPEMCEDEETTGCAAPGELEVLSKVTRMSGSSLAEDSTPIKLTSALENYVKQLDESTTHHEYLIALLIIFLSESGFYVLPMPETSFGEPRKLTYIPPKQWKSEEDTYEIKFVLKDLPTVVCKLVAIPSGDRLILNFFSTTEEKKVYSLAVQSLKYVNPFSSDLSGRYMNLKEISYRFKDTLATRVRSDMLTAAGLTNPSLQGLPTELKLKILGMLDAHTLIQISQCSRQFNELCKEPQLWKTLLSKDFPEEKAELDDNCLNCYRTKHTERIKKRRQDTCCNICDSDVGQSHPPWVHPRIEYTQRVIPYHHFQPFPDLRFHDPTRDFYLEFGDLFRFRF